MSQYSSEKLNENVFDYLPLTFFVECDMSKQKQQSKNMVNYMNAFYALDDIKKRTRKFFNKVDGISDDPTEKPQADEPQDGETPSELEPNKRAFDKDKLDDPFIFKHFY
jgi:hypothetical protein